MSAPWGTWLSGFFAGFGVGWIIGRTTMRRWMEREIKILRAEIWRRQP